MATIDVGSYGSISGARALAGGYVAWGTYYATSSEGRDQAATWFSPDGRTWERTIHSEVISPCPGWTERQDLELMNPVASAGDGRSLVIMATFLLPDAEACDRAWVISLSTTDGRTWVRSQPFGPKHGDPAWSVWAEDAWAIPGGWEASVKGGEGGATIWRSTDLVTWDQVSGQPGSVDDDFTAGGAAPDGTRLAVSGTSEAGLVTLLTSTDSITWRVVHSLPTDFDVRGIAPPSEAGRPWLVATAKLPETGGGEARVLVSTDLQTWQSSTFPRVGIGALTVTRFGWIAVGYWPSLDTGCGDECPPIDDPTLFVSPDGVSWVEHALPPEKFSPFRYDGLFVEGDPGLLAIDGANSTGSEFVGTRVWRMTSGE